MNRPHVFINVAMTADGKLDTFERKGSTISSRRDKERVDRLRAEADAVMVGGHTLLGDDPKLTVKSESLRMERVARGLSSNPMKVGIVSRADLRADSNFLTVGSARIVIFTTSQTSNDQLKLLQNYGVEVFMLGDSRVDLKQALGKLYTLGVRRLMVEGGGTLNFELLNLGLVDELTAYVAPIIFGGESAPTAAAGLGLAQGEAIPLSLVNVERWDDEGVLLHYRIGEKSNDNKDA
ncbi:MAG TPA: 2,5-diamino-6-(ribosylamino)-4(3H)-pyrimidinone 5'-phosphate reductase [Anaerolineales bacterium]|nr:2,5-diamino-6-(ribosylamino)-4(3H)-pyrimidinone 5'-phosphate reductase [Anaerolineales bacterium]